MVNKINKPLYNKALFLGGYVRGGRLTGHYVCGSFSPKSMPGQVPSLNFSVQTLANREHSRATKKTRPNFPLNPGYNITFNGLLNKFPHNWVV